MSAVAVQCIEAFPCWTIDAEVIALLASCAARRPAGKWNRQYFAISFDEWFTYQGTRADRLGAIRNRYGERALARSNATDNYDALDAWIDSPTVEQAIDAAYALRHDAKVAA